LASPLEQSSLAGDWQHWDTVWRGMRQSGADAVLYTDGTPRTLLEFWQRAYFEDLWGLMGAPEAGARCLELGAGRGTTSMYLARRECDVTLVDLAPAGLELAVRNFEHCGLRPPRAVVADARETGLEGGEYDCVYNIGLLEHFADPVPVLREALRLLKPGGLLFMVIIPEGSPWRSAPIRLGLNPFATGLRLAAALGRRVRGQAFATTTTTGGADPTVEREMLRTSHSRPQYLAWMRELGQEAAECVPYNPYFSLYRTPVLERVVTVPLYRWHLRMIRGRARYPRLQVEMPIAACDLLMCRRGGRNT
jgi:2-polyprenyl-3-methyl-5-hydroxy-6-metoxy-1,4-benzoquinol methylase